MKPRTFDWESARRQLAERQEALTREASPEQRRALWRARAAKLATPPSPPDDTARVDVLLVRAGGPVLALEVRHSRGAFLRPHVTLVPAAPAAVLGATFCLGQLLMVADLATLMGHSKRGDGTAMVVVHHAEMLLGLAVEEVVDARVMSFGGVRTAGAGRFVHTLLTDSLPLLDVAALVTAPELVVNAEDM